MAEPFLFVVVVGMLGFLGLIGVVAAIVEFTIWIRCADQRFDETRRRVQASPVIAVVWMLLGFAMFVMLYLVLMENVQ
jgi:uncharacterized BrkB/YihY/UPF0761 family membrane protein